MSISGNELRKNKKYMIYGILIVAGIYLVSLVWLYASVARYAKFWDKKAQESGEITYIALGDSAAQAIGATSPMRGYVGIIATRLAEKTGKKVRIVNLSKTGATIQDYLIDQAPRLADYRADIVTIEIGANDVATYDEATFRKSFRAVLDSLPKGSYVSNMPLFNSRPNSTAKGRAASVVVESLLREYPQLHFVDLQRRTTEHQSIFGFAPDLFHPNNVSYKNWADAFWGKINQEM